MYHEENDVEFESSSEKRIAAELKLEREQSLEFQISRDEKRRKLRLLKSEEAPGQKKLKREMQREALTRLEEAARSQSDFKEVTDWWNKLDENRERRERNYEITRRDVPLEYGAAKDGTIFPTFLCSPFWRELCSGYLLNIVFDCPYEMHELLTSPILSEIVSELKDDHKELLYYRVLRQYSSTELGALLGQSDRNIRKKWARLIKRMQKRLFEYLLESEKNGQSLSYREKTFLDKYQNSVLDDNKDGW